MLTSVNRILDMFRAPLYRWISTHRIDISDKQQEISDNAASLESLLSCITINPESDNNFSQKLFFTLMDIVQRTSPTCVDVNRLPFANEKSASSAIPLRPLRKYVSVDNIRAALAIHASSNPGMFVVINTDEVDVLKNVVNSPKAANKILLDEKQLALLTQLVFSPVIHMAVLLHSDDEKSKSEEEFEHEPNEGKSKAVAENVRNMRLPNNVVDLAIEIFGDQRAAALILLFSKSYKPLLYSAPALTNLLLAIPVKFINIFTATLMNFGGNGLMHFHYYNLEKELDVLHKMVLTKSEKYLKKLTYVMAWSIEHDIHSESNFKKLIDCEDYIEYFPEIKIAPRERPFNNDDEAALIRAEDRYRNQKIFDLIIHHMQMCEKLYNIQNKHIFDVMVEANLGSDINKLICNFNDSVETQGLFAKKYLRQMPDEKELSPTAFLSAR